MTTRIKHSLDELDAIGYQEYLTNNPFYVDLLEPFPNEITKIVKPPYETVTENVTSPLVSEYDDLIRLHYLIRKRKVTTILEFGIGKSTVVFNNALNLNKRDYGDYVENNLRRANAFECHSLDNDAFWIDHFELSYKNLNNVTVHQSDVEMDMVCDRICSLYKKLPNICPDFIYLDAPGMYSVKGNVNGIHTRHSDRVPIAADLILIEYYLLPGTLVVVDGRTSNARYLRNNFQREWEYTYISEYDQHFFELVEEPLGLHNRKQLEFNFNSK